MPTKSRTNPCGLLSKRARTSADDEYVCFDFLIAHLTFVSQGQARITPLGNGGRLSAQSSRAQLPADARLIQLRAALGTKRHTEQGGFRSERPKQEDGSPAAALNSGV